MRKSDITVLKRSFSRYIQSFSFSGEEDLRNINLKINHAFEVCKNSIQIAKREVTDHTAVFTAEAIALLHDVGRFSQYAQYRTFDDRLSVNHGELGARVIQNEQLLKDFHLHEQDIILSSVKFHNAFALPKLMDSEKEFFLKLIRDADKLDIWRVFIEYFESSEDERASAAALGFPDQPQFSEEILSGLYDKQMVSLAKVNTLNDYKLIQLSWIYDLHFTTSYSLLLERNYIDRIIVHLPQTERIRQLSPFLKKYALSRSG